MNAPVELGVYVGRFCPPHEGHCRVIRHLLEERGPANSLVLVGSSNHAISYRRTCSPWKAAWPCSASSSRT